MTGKRILHRRQRLAVGQGGRYRLISYIGEDPLGQVWHGEDRLLGAAVTVRLVSQPLTQDPARVEAFRDQLNELRQRLDHPNIAWVYYFNDGEDGAIEFVVMAELGRQTLAHRLKRDPGLQPPEGFAIGAAISEGLQAAHDLGFVHGNLTTHSVMLSEDGSVKIMDFGTAALRLDPDGDPDPEDPARDVRALGKILLEVVGSVPSRGGGQPASGEGMGEELVRLWKASLDPDPARRPSAESLAFALRDAEAGATRRVLPFEAVETLPPTEPNRPAPGDPLPREGRVEELVEQERTLAVEELRVELWDDSPEAEAARLAEKPARAGEEAKRGEHRRQLDDAKASRPARAEQASLMDDARRGEGAVRGSEGPAGAATEPGGPPGGRASAPGEEPRAADEAEPALRPNRPSVMASAGPSGPMRVSRRRPSAGFLHRGTWLLLGGIFLVTAVVGFLLSRLVTEPKQTPQNIPQDTTGSEPIVMPDLRGLTYGDARTRLEAASLALAKRVKAQGEAGIVVATDPSLGQLVRPGTAVTVYVGADPPDESAVDSL